MCFSVSYFPAHGEGTITSLDKHIVDWRRSLVLYKHVQGVVALMVKVIVNSYCVEYIQLTSSHTQVLPLISELLFIF